MFLAQPTLHKVGSGNVHNTKDDMIMHFKSIPSYLVKVSIVDCVDPDTPLPMPVEEDDLMTMGAAIGTYVLWPTSLIVINTVVCNALTLNSFVDKIFTFLI